MGPGQGGGQEGELGWVWSSGVTEQTLPLPPALEDLLCDFMRALFLAILGSL